MTLNHNLFLLLTLFCIAEGSSIGRRTIEHQQQNLHNNNEQVEEYAMVSTVEAGKLVLASGTLSVWSPNVTFGDSSFSSVGLYTTSPAGGVLDSIQAGWIVRPDQYGDSRPRLFTYWTSGLHNHTGCFNLVCEGFVQLVDDIVVGAPISPVSSISQHTYEISITIFKDFNNEQWILQFGFKVVGYWQKGIFSKMEKRAEKAEWGGTVVTSKNGGAHTMTEMGSGRLPVAGFGKSAHMHGLVVLDKDKGVMTIGGRGVNFKFVISNPKCYNIRNQTYYNQSLQHPLYSYFYYGGPGKGLGCP